MIVEANEAVLMPGTAEGTSGACRLGSTTGVPD